MKTFWKQNASTILPEESPWDLRSGPYRSTKQALPAPLFRFECRLMDFIFNNLRE